MTIEQGPGCGICLRHPLDTLKSVKESFRANAQTGGAGAVLKPRIEEPSEEAFRTSTLSVPQLVQRRVEERSQGFITEASQIPGGNL